MRNVRIGHLTRVRVATIRKFFRYVQEGLPGTLYQIHVLNVVSFFDKIVTLIKPFMRAEIFKVVSVTFDQIFAKCTSFDNFVISVLLVPFSRCPHCRSSAIHAFAGM